MVNYSKGPWLTFNVKSLTHGGLTDHLDFQIRWYIKQKSNNFWKQVMTFPLSISFVQNIFNTILFTYYKNLLTLVVKYKAPLSPKSTSQVAGQGEQGKDRNWGKSNTYFICCEVSLAHFFINHFAKKSIVCFICERRSGIRPKTKISKDKGHLEFRSLSNVNLG